MRESDAGRVVAVLGRASGRYAHVEILRDAHAVEHVDELAAAHKRVVGHEEEPVVVLAELSDRVIDGQEGQPVGVVQVGHVDHVQALGLVGAHRLVHEVDDLVGVLADRLVLNLSIVGQHARQADDADEELLADVELHGRVQRSLLGLAEGLLIGRLERQVDARDELFRVVLAELDEHDGDQRAEQNRQPVAAILQIQLAKHGVCMCARTMLIASKMRERRRSEIDKIRFEFGGDVASSQQTIQTMQMINEQKRKKERKQLISKINN